MNAARERRPALGYALAAAAAAMWALNGSIARFLLDDGVSAQRLSQLRSFGSWLALVIVLAIFRRDLLRVERREIPQLAFIGIGGLALVHAAYFVAIDRLADRRRADDPVPRAGATARVVLGRVRPASRPGARGRRRAVARGLLLRGPRL